MSVAKTTDLLLRLVGFALLLAGWYLVVDVLALPRFSLLPGPTEVLSEWSNRVAMQEYYADIWASLRRILLAFTLAVGLGVPLGFLMGWSLRFREVTFPLLELIRPIPILAWVPLAVLMFPAGEAPVVFLTFLSAFFVTVLNTILGVQSVDRDLIRAAQCLGARPKDVFRGVTVPGALPYVLTGLEIAMGVAWFSLVAGEIIAGESGLGYFINNSYTTTQYPAIVIGMLTLGLIGYATSAAVRSIGHRLIPQRSQAKVA